MTGHIGKNMPIDMGSSIVLRHGSGVHVLATTRSGPHFAPEFFRSAGFEPFDASVVVAKSPCGFRAVYEEHAAAIYSVKAPGCAPSDFWNYEFNNIPHPPLAVGRPGRMVAHAGSDPQVTLPVSYNDVLAALPRVHALLKPTLLLEWPGLTKLLGFPFHLKHENHQPVGVFKVRGGINYVSTLEEPERAAGIIGVSTGNHGQSLAYACRHFQVPCTIVVPEQANPDKCLAIRNLGAELIQHGRDFNEAMAHIEQLLETRGGRYVHSGNEPLLIAGVGTMAWEVFEDLPQPDVILVPIGLGSGVCGTCIVAKHRYPKARVIGVQSENAPAVAQSWRIRKHVTTESANTWAEGFATRAPAESLPLEIMHALMDDVILVGEDDLRLAAYWILKHTHNLAEGAGAGALAAAFKERDRFRRQASCRRLVRR